MTYRKEEDDQTLVVALELAKSVKNLTKAFKSASEDDVKAMNLAVIGAYQEAMQKVEGASSGDPLSPEDLAFKQQVVNDLRRVAAEVCDKYAQEYQGVQEHLDVGEAIHLITKIDAEMATLKEKHAAAESLLVAVEENAALSVNRLYAHQLISKHQDDVDIVMAGGTEQEQTAWVTKMSELTKVAEDPDNFDIVKGNAMATLATVTFPATWLGRQLPESVQNLGRNFLQTNDSQIKDTLKGCAQQRIDEIASKSAALEIQKEILQLRQTGAEGKIEVKDRSDRITQLKYNADHPIQKAMMDALTTFKCTCLGILDSIQKVASNIKDSLTQAGKDAYKKGGELYTDAKAFCSRKATAVSVATGEAKESVHDWGAQKVADFQEWNSDRLLKASPKYKEQRALHAQDLLQALKQEGKEPDDALKPEGS